MTMKTQTPAKTWQEELVEAAKATLAMIEAHGGEDGPLAAAIDRATGDPLRAAIARAELLMPKPGTFEGAVQLARLNLEDAYAKSAVTAHYLDAVAPHKKEWADAIGSIRDAAKAADVAIQKLDVAAKVEP